jgi:hypothetical protein
VAKENPGKSAGWIAQTVQGSAFPDRYDQQEKDAQGWVDAWGGGEGTPEGSAAGGGTYAKSYQFVRGAGENSWAAMQRLAEEVGWRLFVVGNSLYYMSEADLYARRPRYTFTPDDPAILELSYDVDWGKAVSEMTATVALSRWEAPPGSVVTVDGFNVPDGRWLVTAITRDYFAPTADITLKQPGKAKLEPAPEQGERAAKATGDGTATEQDDGSKTAKLYREAKTFSGGYVWGGGHSGPLSNFKPADGLDCSGSCSLALKRAGMYSGDTAMVSGDFAASYGQPGPGKHFTVWANSEHVWIQFHGLGSGKRFDTSPHGDGPRGPRVRNSDRSDTGRFTARHWPGA